MSAVILTLPYPPATNNLFINLPRGGRAKSSRYKAWCEEAGWTIKGQRLGKVSGPYALYIQANRPDARKRDLDGIVKPISDALKTAGIIDDDSLCQHLDMRWYGKGKLVWINVIATEVAG